MSDLVLLAVSLFTWGIGEGLFIYFQPIYLAQLGADTMTIATVFSAFGLAMMVAHIPAGYLADRIGRKPLLIAAWSSGLIATWVMAFARTLPVFIVGMLLYGFTAFVSSPLNSYVTTARGKFSPVRAMTFMSAAYNFGAVIGPLAGRVMVQKPVEPSPMPGPVITGVVLIVPAVVVHVVPGSVTDENRPNACAAQGIPISCPVARCVIVPLARGIVVEEPVEAADMPGAIVTGCRVQVRPAVAHVVPHAVPDEKGAGVYPAQGAPIGRIA